MKGLGSSFSVVSEVWHRRKTKRTAIVLGGILASATAAGALIVLFAVFRDTTGSSFRIPLSTKRSGS